MPVKRRILIAGGGTGGHLFPGLAIAEAFLNNLDCDVRFVGTVNGIEKDVIPEKGFHLYTIPISGLYRVGATRFLKTLLKFPLAFFKSLFILLKYKPHLIIGIGGYASGPVLAVSILLGKNTIIQEQNAYPGLTNRLLGRWVPLAFIPFSDASNLFKNPVVVGNPVRQQILKTARKPDKRSDEEFVISILGGSQGARILNKSITAILPKLASIGTKIRINHHAGKLDYDWVKAEYQNFPGLTVNLSPFFTNIDEIYLESRLILCRAGGSVNEIVAMGRAAILVPIANSSGDHQLANAKAMEAAGAAILIEEKDLKPDELFKVINNLVHSPEEIEAMEKKSKGLFAGDSAEIIAENSIQYYKL